MLLAVALAGAGTVETETERPYSDDDLFYMSHIVQAEAGYCSREMMEGVASVVINRVNDDRFPELLEWGTSTDKGAKIVFYQDGELLETKVSAAFSFLKKENLLFSRSGTGNLFTESIYVFAGDSFEVYQSGIYGTMDAAITSYTKAGKPEYTYKWEGSIVSEAGYRDALLFLYDENRALDPNKITMLGTEEMLAELKK